MTVPPDFEDRFEIRRLLGSGSFGVVYEAFDRQRNRVVALKTLARADAESVTRFKREFRSLAELRHPNLASMYELLVLGESWVLSMEPVHGTDLLEHLSFAELQSSFLEGPAQPFDPDERVSFRRSRHEGKLSAVYLDHVRDAFRQLAEAIAFLHANGVVHRDIKPSNVMITPEGRVVLLDFGLAAESRADELDAGTIVGTPGYMSPEQIATLPPAPASDWYSFGVILYQALTGRRPFLGLSGTDIIDQQLRGTITPAAVMLPGVPEELATLADQCMDRDPSRRPSDAVILERLGSSLVRERGGRSHPRVAELIGRGREVRNLFRQVTSMIEQGGCGMVLLHGSPGVGKSVLADRLLDEIRAKTDALIVGGHCHGWESLPYNAIDAIVDSIARLARTNRSPAVDREMGRSVAMPRLFPTLAFDTGAAPEDETVILPPTPAKMMDRASMELHALLGAMAGERPVVLFLDDAQWGDYQSSEVFRRLLTIRSPLRIVLVLCYRTEDWRTSLLVQALLNAPVPRYELRLDELSGPMMDKLVKRQLPDRPPEVRRRIHQQAGGNPALAEIITYYIAMDGEEPRLAPAVATRLADLSASALRVFALLLGAEGPLAEETVEDRLELFESDEPLRTLTRERLIRFRRTGDLLELDLYHPRMREVLRSS